MKKIIPFLLLFFLGCSTVKVASNKSPEFTGGIQRVYVTIKGMNGSESFFNRFNQQFIQKLRVKRLDVEYHYHNSLSLETEEEVARKIDAFQPDFVLLVEQTDVRQSVEEEFWTGEVSSSLNSFLDVRLQAYKSDPLLWRANISVQESYNHLSALAGEKAAKKLVRKMEEDGLVE